MKPRYLTICLLTVLIATASLDYVFATSNFFSEDQPEFFLGIDVAYHNMDEMYDLIDEVRSYTNVFVIGTTGITNNRTALLEVCQYLYDRDMYFIVYLESYYRLLVMSEIEEKFGDRLLGVYFDDEQGGRQLDQFEWRWVNEATNYSDASNQYVQGLKWWLNRRYLINGTATPAPSDYHLFTSDYTFYWYDYKAGYDTVFAEFGWNYSRQLNVALCRGAATVQNKDWGVIMTWTYNDPPYLESGIELYNDLVLAYENGAKYILIFDSNEDYSHEILQKEHLDSLEQFWIYVNNHPRSNEALSDRVVYVLPEDYGYGFRGPDDKIWGLWEADSFSYDLSVELGSLLEEHKGRLDIIYDDPQFSFLDKYSRIYFWNGTSVFGNISCVVSSSIIPLGNSIEISGVISPVMLGNVTLQFRINNGTTWSDLVTLPVRSNGNYSYIWMPDFIGSYDFRAISKGAGSISESNSSNLVVTASKIFSSISLSLSSSFINEGDSISVSGVIDPALSGKNVTITIRRPDGLRANRTVTTGYDGSFVDSFLPDAGGYWGVSTSWSGDATYDGALGIEQTFEVTNLYRAIGLQNLTIPILGGAVAGIVITVLVFWFVLRLRRKNSAKSVIPGYVVKARLLGLGSGTLEFIDNVIKFTLKEGRIRKSKRLCRKIAMPDIEGMTRIGNQLSIGWKGVNDVFIIEEEELAGTIFERIPQSSRKQRIVFEGKKIAKQSRNDLVNILSTAMETVNLLFDIIWSLKETGSWNHVEGFLDRCEDNVRYLKSQEIALVDLDFTDLSLATKKRDAELASKEAYDILKLMYNFFSGLSKSNDSFIQSHPNFSDMKRIVFAYYLLNDIILGLVVEDKIEEEANLLVHILDKLSKDTGFKIDTDVINDAIIKVGVEQEKQSVIEKCRAVFKEQVKKLLGE